MKNFYKAEVAMFNRFGKLSPERSQQYNKNLDAYYESRTDYMNGRSDSYIPIMDVLKNAGRTDMSNPTVSMHVDKIEKDVDIDSLLTKLISIFNKNNTRNSVSYLKKGK